ncbi:MAG: hypothetical protein Q6370_020145 [Candidatus Sigynarchaeota archaeon]
MRKPMASPACAASSDRAHSVSPPSGCTFAHCPAFVSYTGTLYLRATSAAGSTVDANHACLNVAASRSRSSGAALWIAITFFWPSTRSSPSESSSCASAAAPSALPMPHVSSDAWTARWGTKSTSAANSVESRNPATTNGCRLAKA